MKVSEEEVRQVLEVLELPVKKWNSARLATKVANLAEVVAPCEDKLDDLSSDQRNLIDKIISANEEGEEIEFESEESEEDEVTIVVETKKKGKKPAKEKSAKEKATTEKPAKEKKARGEASNKATVYKAWAKSKDKSTKKADEYAELVEGRVKTTTIRGWISSWGRGQNLPACAKEKNT